MKKDLKPNTCIAPVPVALITCGDFNNSNILTVAWMGIISSEPPMVYISVRPSRYSYELIKNNMEFVINLPNKNIVEKVDYCGLNSGKDVNKFEKCEFTKGEAKIVKAPIIEQCPINIECKVKEIKNYGSHDMFVAQVVNVRANEEFVNEYGIINYSGADLLGYVGKKYCIINEEIGSMGISKR